MSPWKPKSRSQQQPKQRAPDYRESARKRGYDRDWERCREAFLTSEPLCADCLERGMVTPANEVHHVAKVKDRPDLRLDRENLRALCKTCHSRRTARGE